jgi:hypothetical protein
LLQQKIGAIPNKEQVCPVKKVKFEKSRILLWKGQNYPVLVGQKKLCGSRPF